MSRSGYSDDFDSWDLIRYRGAVASAIKGRRGQSFLRELLQALDALPERKLIAGELEEDGAVCAIGAVGKVRGVDMSTLDPADSQAVSATFGVADALAREISFMNDDVGAYDEAPEARYMRMRKWVEGLLNRSNPQPVRFPLTAG